MSRIGELSDEAGIWLMLKTKRVLYDEESPRNGRVIVIDTEAFGRVMLIGHNLAFQTTERLDVYDEILGHLTLNEHPNPENVLIIGGGDGRIAKIALEHGAKRVVMLEIDPLVIEASKEYLKVDGGALEEIEILLGDAFETLDSLESNTFDVVIGDYSDPYPDEPAKSLLGEAFISKIKRVMKDDGIVALQSGSPVFQARMVKKVYYSLKPMFKYVRPFRSPSPVYPGGVWTYMIASDVKLNGPYRDVSGEFYNIEIHRSLYVLPEFVKKLLAER